MSNGFYLTPAEQIDFLDDCEKDENGNLAYGERAAEIIDRARKRALEEEAAEAADEAADAAETPETLETPMTVIEKAQAQKREKKKLKGEHLDPYISKAKRILDKNQREIDNGGKMMTKREFAAGIELGESTVRQNDTLNDIYERFKADNSNVRPSTVNNDPDSFFDDDF